MYALVAPALWYTLVPVGVRVLMDPGLNQIRPPATRGDLHYGPPTSGACITTLKDPCGGRDPNGPWCAQLLPLPPPQSMIPTYRGSWHRQVNMAYHPFPKKFQEGLRGWGAMQHANQVIGWVSTHYPPTDPIHMFKCIEFARCNGCTCVYLSMQPVAPTC